MVGKDVSELLSPFLDLRFFQKQDPDAEWRPLLYFADSLSDGVIDKAKRG